MSFEIVHADNLEFLARLRPECIDAFVEDPPYGLAFMSKAWDYAVPGPEYFAEQLRVAKPGAHLVAFGGTRTYHRLACAVEDAGWELRDCLMWLYGTGFPKSLDVSKAIDKAEGAERQIIGRKKLNPRDSRTYIPTRGGGYSGTQSSPNDGMNITAPATEAAKHWDGWGTALKPAWEPIILARKPFKATVANNVLAHGVGALNIDGCRIGTSKAAPHSPRKGQDRIFGEYAAQDGSESGHNPNIGRWPANVILDPEAGAVLGEPARFFYCAKASKGERELGLEDFNPQQVGDGRETPADNAYQRGKTERKNTHTTVKPIALMQWLCRLVTPPGGIVCDPFCGSGSTGCAAVSEGFSFLGVEREAEYVAIANARVAHWSMR